MSKSHGDAWMKLIGISDKGQGKRGKGGNPKRANNLLNG